MRTIKSVRLVNHGVEHEQYFQGHGTAFTEYDTCATGIGDSELEAYEDSLEQLAGELDSAELAKIEELLSEQVSCLSDCEDPVVTEAVEEMDAACDAHVYVSIDVQFYK